jgi:hypothetical protein
MSADLHDVLPALATLDLTNNRWGYVKLMSNGALTQRSVDEKHPNFSDVCLVQTCLRVLRATKGPSSFFPFHIDLIIQRGAQKQMIRSNARGVVAPMADEQSFGDLPLMNCPRETVCKPVLTEITGASVASPIAGASPEPTFFRLLNVLPEAFFERGPVTRPVSAKSLGWLGCWDFSATAAQAKQRRFGRLKEHSDYLTRNRGATPRAASTAPGLRLVYFNRFAGSDGLSWSI